MPCQSFQQQQYDHYVLGLAEPFEETVIRAHIARGCARCSLSVARGNELLLDYAVRDAGPLPHHDAQLRHRIVTSVQQTANLEVTKDPNPSRNLDRFEKMIELLADTKHPNSSERSSAFLAFWRELAAEMRAARNARREAMFASNDWDFSLLIRDDLAFARVLAGLRWILFRYQLGLALDILDLSALVKEGLAFSAAG